MKLTTTIFFLLIINSIYGNHEAFGQELKVVSKVDTTVGLIGDQINYSMIAKKSKGIKEIIFPSLPDTFGGLEIVERGKIDTLKNSNSEDIVLEQKFIITSFDSGTFIIPEFVFQYERFDREDLIPISTNSIALKFNTMVVDTSKPIKEIKSPFDEPISIWDYFVEIIIGFIIIGAIISGFLYYKNKKKTPNISHSFDPKIPAHTYALEQLIKLKSEELWQKGHFKEYHDRLSQILRNYIERRYNFFAMEMITSEIIENLKLSGVSNDNIERIRLLLSIADLAKFAKFNPLPDENDRSMRDAIEFINSTTRMSEIVKDTNNGDI